MAKLLDFYLQTISEKVSKYASKVSKTIQLTYLLRKGSTGWSKKHPMYCTP